MTDLFRVFPEKIYQSTSIYVEMVDCSESHKMIKISWKMDKSDKNKEFSSDILFFIQRISSD